jgi:hypothetical protein
MPELADFLLRDERSRRAYLAVIADNQNFLAAQERRKLSDIRLRRFVDNDELDRS